MTTIEKKIYHLLERERVDAIKREAVAILYAEAFKSSPRVYNAVQWDRLQARIKEKCGLRALNQMKRRALKGCPMT